MSCILGIVTGMGIFFILGACGKWSLTVRFNKIIDSVVCACVCNYGCVWKCTSCNHPTTIDMLMISPFNRVKMIKRIKYTLQHMNLSKCIFYSNWELFTHKMSNTKQNIRMINIFKELYQLPFRVYYATRSS